ncbi:MAG: hypothetical protein AUJ57_11315 [Zetaproteobacteria bacterium CG1_02_53_45]|nr:MAG: hypothetical protein AUJ57_11315 [Zetaproteobacteria bacterium CG1_02_53_45]
MPAGRAAAAPVSNSVSGLHAWRRSGKSGCCRADWRADMRALLIAICCLLAVLPASAGPGFQAGEWEITTSTAIPDMPVTVPPMTFRQCMLDENSMAQQSSENSGCRILEQQKNGDTLNWKVSCESEQGRADISGSLTWSGDSMQGTTAITTDPGGQQMTVITRMQGKRLGPCR